jgi:hypothetical protein
VTDLCRGGVSLHETLAFRVAQNATFAAAALGDQTTGTVNASWVELNEFGVLQRDAGAQCHGISVAGAGMGGRAAKVAAARPSCCQHCVLGIDAVDAPVFHVETKNSNAFAILHDQIECEIFDEISSVEGETATVKRMQHGVTRSIGGSCATVRLASLSEVERLSTECPLINFAVLSTGKRHAVGFELEHGSGSFATHVMNGILVTKPVRSLDSVVHVPAPVVLGHVPECSIDSSLGRHGVRSSGEKFRDTRCLETSLSESHSSTKTGTTSTYDYSVVVMVN